jgi:hypothetical protein
MDHVKGAGLLVSGLARKMLVAVLALALKPDKTMMDSASSRLAIIVLGRPFLPDFNRLSPINTN